MRKPSLALPQRLLGAFALVNVDEQVVPVDDTPIRIPKRKSARLKPAIGAIETSSADFDLKGFADAIDRVKTSTARGRSSG